MPASSDTAARKTLKRLQDVAVGVFAELDQLQANPLPNSVAIIDLKTVMDDHGGKLPVLPEGVSLSLRLS